MSCGQRLRTLLPSGKVLSRVCLGLPTSSPYLLLEISSMKKKKPQYRVEVTTNGQDSSFSLIFINLLYIPHQLPLFFLESRMREIQIWEACPLNAYHLDYYYYYF